MSDDPEKTLLWHLRDLGRRETWRIYELPKGIAERAGFEPPQDFPEKTTVSEQGGAESGAHAAPIAVSDPDLRAVVSAWPELPEALRKGIVAMVKAASGNTTDS